MSSVPPTEPPPAPVTSAPIRHLELKAGLLLFFAALIVCGYTAYVAYARGIFESNQRLILAIDNDRVGAEGIFVGMDVTYLGFPIGRVRRIMLGDDAKARVELSVPARDAHWLRETSVFMMETGLVGGARIRVITTQPTDPPLSFAKEKPLLRGDPEDLSRIVARTKDLVENLQKLTATDSSLDLTLGNVKVVTERITGKGGALGVALGSEENARKVVAAIDRTNRLLDSLSGVSLRLDQTLAKADQRVFGRDGVMDETQKAVVQLNAVLGDARESLKRADAVLADAQKTSGSIRGATDDLAGLRAEVDASLRKVAGLIDEINRKWPFKRDTELKLP